MSLRRKRRRTHEHQRRQDTQPTRRPEPVGEVREVDDSWLSLDWLVAAQREVEEADRRVEWAPTEALPDGESCPTVPSSSRGLREAAEVERLAYSRRQAAEALGVSISTIDRRVVPSIETVKLPWGQRLIPVDELERFLRNHIAPARRRTARRHVGRPPTLPRSVVERIRLDYARGRGLAEIARTLTAEGVPTAHSGRRWWASTVRAVLVRSGGRTIREPGAQLGLDDVELVDEHLVRQR